MKKLWLKGQRIVNWGKKIEFISRTEYLDECGRIIEKLVAKDFQTMGVSRNVNNLQYFNAKKRRI